MELLAIRLSPQACKSLVIPQAGEGTKQRGFFVNINQSVTGRANLPWWLNINLSQTLEQHLAEIIRQAQRGQWLTENKGALDECNRRIELCGTFSDGLRRF